MCRARDFHKAISIQHGVFQNAEDVSPRIVTKLVTRFRAFNVRPDWDFTISLQ